MSATTNLPPSPTPPWGRLVQVELTETLTAAGALTLARRVTYLDATSGGPYAMTLANGTYKGQIKAVYVPGANVSTTATFNLTGSFAGFTSLQFTTIGHSAILEWDGAKWHMVGGNAVVVP